MNLVDWAPSFWAGTFFLAGFYFGYVSRKAKLLIKARRIVVEQEKAEAKQRHPTNVYRGVTSSDPERPDFMP
jgi:hypothetical protein